MHYVAIEESRQDLLKQLQERLKARLEPARAADVEAFARHFYATVPVEDLVDRRLDDLYGATLSIWQFLQNHDPLSPKVRCLTPISKSMAGSLPTLLWLFYMKICHF